MEASIQQLESIEDELAFGARWAELDAQYSGHVALWTARAQRLIRGKHFDDALEIICQREIDEFDEDTLATKAGLLYDARAFDQATELFDQLVERFSPGHPPELRQAPVHRRSP